MSASPSGLSNGQTPTPNGGPGGPPGFVRKPKAADPLRPRKKPVRRPNVLPKATPGQSNGLTPARPTGPNTLNGFAPTPARGPAPQPGPSNGTNAPRPIGGWTHTPTGEYRDFPLFTTKRALREGLRYHIAKFSAKKEIDPTNQNEFTRPVVLHRRDPRQPPPGKAVKEEDIPSDVPVDSKERERLEALKAEKDRRKAEDLKQIAPTGNNAAALAAKKTQSFRNEKTTQVHHVDKTEEQKKASDLRYEEALPWHIEDADNKNTWVGNYEAALSDTNVMFVIEGGVFKMVPIEKWYKFTPKNQFKTYTIEEAEAQMSKKIKESRWVMKTNEEKKAAQEAQESRKITHGIYTVKSESSTFKNSGKRETEDMDDLDFAADDLFQDDDEQATFEPDNDEDTKDAKEKIKREQLGANVFGEADEAEVDKELAEERREKERTKKEGKGTRKALKKRERNLIYESDSDHPYSTPVCISH
jgi:transcription initiation factor TFIIF subunit alpha